MLWRPSQQSPKHAIQGITVIKPQGVTEWLPSSVFCMVPWWRAPGTRSGKTGSGSGAIHQYHLSSSLSCQHDSWGRVGSSWLAECFTSNEFVHNHSIIKQALEEPGYHIPSKSEIRPYLKLTEPSVIKYESLCQWLAWPEEMENIGREKQMTICRSKRLKGNYFKESEMSRWFWNKLQPLPNLEILAIDC